MMVRKLQTAVLNREVIMDGFYEYLEGNGVEHIRDLTGFVENFLRDPTMFFELSGAERNEMGKRLDHALAFFKIENSQPR